MVAPSASPALTPSVTPSPLNTGSEPCSGRCEFTWVQSGSTRVGREAEQISTDAALTVHMSLSPSRLSCQPH